MTYLLFFILSAQIIFLLLMMAGFQIALTRPAVSEKALRDIFLSVVIPFRNEQKNSRLLVESLKKQRYLNFEVILIDDHSTDESFDAFVCEIKGDPKFKVIRASGTGKKNALTEAIQLARGEVVVTSDADCTHPENWLNHFRRAFNETHVQLVFGFVRMIPGNSIFQRLQTLEFSSVVATGVSAYGLGSPIYCNGANLAFRRNAFFDVDGYEGNFHVPSGDDEFLLKKISARFPNGVHFLNVREAIVSTSGTSNLREFLQQRLRWAGKWRRSSGVVSKLIAVFVLLVQLAVIVSVAYLFTSVAPPMLKYLLGGKVMMEFVFLFIVCQYQQTPLRVFHFVILEILYPFYVIYVGLTCNFLPYQWKDRTVKLDGAVVGVE